MPLNYRKEKETMVHGSIPDSFFEVKRDPVPLNFRKEKCYLKGPAYIIM